MAASAGAVLLALATILLTGKLGGEAAVRLRQPAVLGELLAGVLLGVGLLGGPLHLPNLAAGEQGSTAEVVRAFAAIGAILLLFEVGLESKVGAMRKVGLSSLFVALIGIAASFVVGYAASWGLASAWAPWHAANTALPAHLLHIFVGAAMTATSVGITARVLADANRLGSPEARIILSAAVLDDVGGLIILAVVAALVDAAASGAAADGWAIARLAGTAVGFLAVALAVGLRTVPKAYDWMATRFRVAGFPVALAVAFALLMAYLAGLAGLADIVGAFAAGLLLSETRHAHGLFASLRPLAALFVGFFFVTLGMQVDVGALAGNWVAVLGLGTALAALAVVAKLACGLGVVRRQADRLVVGVGMVPRGEVGLIFAGLGLATGLLANWQYALLLYVVFLTTVLTPLWLGRLGDRFHVDLGEPPLGEGLAQAAEP